MGDHYLQVGLYEHRITLQKISEPNTEITCLKHCILGPKINQRTIGPVNAHLISWPSEAQSIQNLENIW